MLVYCRLYDVRAVLLFYDACFGRKGLNEHSFSDGRFGHKSFVFFLMLVRGHYGFYLGTIWFRFGVFALQRPLSDSRVGQREALRLTHHQEDGKQSPGGGFGLPMVPKFEQDCICCFVSEFLALKQPCSDHILSIIPTVRQR